MMSIRIIIEIEVSFYILYYRHHYFIGGDKQLLEISLKFLAIFGNVNKYFWNLIINLRKSLSNSKKLCM